MTVNWPEEKQLFRWIDGEISNWNKWGKGDQKGTLNYLTDDHTLRAIKLIESGEKVSCSKTITFENSTSLKVAPNHFMISAGDTYRENENHERQVAMDYFGLVFHGHSITHVDSLAHFFWNGKTYNGRPSSVVSTEKGATEFDVIPAKGGIITRGILVDVPKLRGVEYIEKGDGVGLEDIKQFENESGIKIGNGDVILLRTGQLGKTSTKGPINIENGSAGPSPDILPFLYEREVSIMGSDTGNDIAPNPYEKFTNPIHQIGIVSMGLWILDNAWLDDLSETCEKNKRWEFAINILPLPMKTVTGSPVNPMAIF